jgi:hypothetical protein
MTFAGAVGSGTNEMFPARECVSRCGRKEGDKMAKRRSTLPIPAPGPAVRRPQNAQLNRQKRRVLTQHYRAKYGVK